MAIHVTTPRLVQLNMEINYLARLHEWWHVSYCCIFFYKFDNDNFLFETMRFDINKI